VGGIHLKKYNLSGSTRRKLKARTIQCGTGDAQQQEATKDTFQGHNSSGIPPQETSNSSKPMEEGGLNIVFPR
jgi:hypothetical protein